MRAFLTRFDVRITLVYSSVATLWIIFSDALLATFANEENQLFTRLSQIKGLGFVAVTSLALFLILSAELSKRRQAEEAEREQGYLAAAMRDSLAALTTLHNVDEVLQKILDYAATVVVSDAGSILRFEADTARVAYLRGYTPEAATFLQDYRFAPDSFICRTALVTQQAYLVEDTHQIPEWLSLPATAWVRSSLGVPITLRGQVIGMVVADSAKPYQFQPKDIEKLQLFAYYASLALENADHVGQLEKKVAARTTELQAAKARVEVILNNSLDGILMVDAALRIQETNPSFNRLVGYSTAQSRQLSLLDFIAEADRERVRAIIDANTNLQVGYHMEIHAVRRSLDPTIVTLFDAELGIASTQAGDLVCTLRDITTRKQAEAALRESEENYRRLVKTMQGGLALYNLNEKITYVNDRFCEMLGYSRAELLTMYSYDFIDQAELPKLKEQVIRRKQAESSSYEILARHKDGHAIHLLVAGSPLLDQAGEFIGSVAVATDITAQKQAETALRQALVKEKELGELKSRFISMASHEFRTPLATILALTETLAAYRLRLTDEQIDQRLQKIREQIEHLKSVMEDVLLLARMQARRSEFSPTPVDLDALCRTVLEEFEDQPQHTHRLIYHYENPPTTVQLDPKLMRRIISNLLSNAIKYSPGGQPITLTLAMTPTAITLQVRDQGIGIPAMDQKHLFEPFHRATNVGTISGTGLGLVITKEAVAMHKGQICVESELGVGTSFTVTLPLE